MVGSPFFIGQVHVIYRIIACSWMVSNRPPAAPTRAPRCELNAGGRQGSCPSIRVRQSPDVCLEPGRIKHHEKRDLLEVNEQHLDRQVPTVGRELVVRGIRYRVLQVKPRKARRPTWPRRNQGQSQGGWQVLVETLEETG